MTDSLSGRVSRLENCIHGVRRREQKVASLAANLFQHLGISSPKQQLVELKKRAENRSFTLMILPFL